MLKRLTLPHLTAHQFMLMFFFGASLRAFFIWRSNLFFARIICQEDAKAERVFTLFVVEWCCACRYFVTFCLPNSSTGSEVTKKGTANGHPSLAEGSLIKLGVLLSLEHLDVHVHLR